MNETPDAPRCAKCNQPFSERWRTESFARWGKLPKCCATCAMENLERFLSEPDPDEIPHDEREQRCQAVGGDAEGQVPTTALDEQRVSREAIRPPGSGVDELEYWRGNAMHYQRLCVALEDEIDNWQLALEGKEACIRRRNEWLAEMERKLSVCLRALYHLRRDRKSPDCVKIYCALIEEQISSGGGGAEQAGDSAATKQSGAGSQNAELRCCGPEAALSTQFPTSKIP